MLAAVDSCSRAYNSWSETSILARQQIFLRYQQLIKDNIVRQRFRQLQVQLFSFRTLDSANPVKSLLLLSHTHTCSVVLKDSLWESCFRKNWPSPSHMNRERHWQMRRGMYSEDCVSSDIWVQVQEIGKCLQGCVDICFVAATIVNELYQSKGQFPLFSLWLPLVSGFCFYVLENQGEI